MTRKHLWDPGNGVTRPLGRTGLLIYRGDRYARCSAFEGRSGRDPPLRSAPGAFVGYTSYPHRTLRLGESTVPEVKIAAETRGEFGKGAARRSRREGRVPAVLYGHGTETRHLTLPGHDLMLALKTPNVLLRLEGLKNGSEIALPKAVHRRDLKLPPGVTLQVEPDTLVLQVIARTMEEAPEEETGEAPEVPEALA